MTTTFSPTGALPTGVCVLEASAGTGKTYALAALTTRYIAEGIASLDQIMLVTFTRLATQELRARVRQRLSEAADALAGTTPATDPVIQSICEVNDVERAARLERVQHALASFDQAMIATTQEFCDAMLTELGSRADRDATGHFIEDFRPLAREAAVDLYLGRYAATGNPPFSIAEAEAIADKLADAPHLQIAEVTSPAAAYERTTFAVELRTEVDRRKCLAGLKGFSDTQTRLLTALTDPRTAASARALLSQRFSIVMVDEFQDTDPVQWEIIRAGFVGVSTVILIGDPKQAIYAFRGADVYSYLAAVEGVRTGAIAGSQQTLGTNYRADAGLVEATHHLMAEAALGDERIAVHPVHAVQPQRLAAPDPWDRPMRVRYHVDQASDGTLPSAEKARSLIAQDLVSDVSALLASDAWLQTDAGARRLGSRDIAVLVNSRAMGTRIQQALIRAGIPAVFPGSVSVLSSPAAQQWHMLLRALAEPTSSHLRQLALTPLVGMTIPEIAAADACALTALAANAHRWAQTLRELGCAAMTRRVLDETNVAERLLQRDDGERLLTDLRHVAQLLNAQASTTAEAAGLLRWLTTQMTTSQARSDDRQQRLETDEAAVQIMTIHASKGLQFPVVYLPEAALEWKPDDHGQAIDYHDDKGVLTTDLSGAAGSGRATRWAQHRHEDGGDSLRRLYVGLTRAESMVTTWWVPTAHNLSASALQRMIFRGASSGLPRVPEPRYTDLQLEASPFLQHPGIALQPLSLVPVTPTAPIPDADSAELAAAIFDRTIDQAWRRTSYSALTASAHHSPVAARWELDEPIDEAETTFVDAVGPLADSPSPMADLPGGTAFGTLTHAVLEQLDPSTADLASAVRRTAERLLHQVHAPELDLTVFVEGMVTALRTPLGALAEGQNLCEIGAANRLAELDFDMVLGGLTTVTLADVAALIGKHLPPDDLLAEYPQHLGAGELGAQQLRGFLTGSIDAVLRMGTPPRYLVVDYKTNRLAPSGAALVLGHYTPAAMAQAMMASHYPLQALLYQVALHRFLRWRQPGYIPTQHLGGVLYLFVRGMAGADAVLPDGQSYGVFSWQPPAALVEELSDLIGGDR